MNDKQIRERCEALVVAVVGKSGAQVWWESFNYHFGCTPNRAFELSPGLVYDYLLKHSEL